MTKKANNFLTQLLPDSESADAKPSTSFGVTVGNHEKSESMGNNPPPIPLVNVEDTNELKKTSTNNSSIPSKQYVNMDKNIKEMIAHEVHQVLQPIISSNMNSPENKSTDFTSPVQLQFLQDRLSNIEAQFIMQSKQTEGYKNELRHEDEVKGLFLQPSSMFGMFLVNYF